MISVEEAIAAVGRSVERLPNACVRLPEALGLRLADPIASAVDSPPFDKSMLDGYAVRSDDKMPTRTIIAEIMAGEVPQHSVEPGTTVRLMTGAPMPAGADAVVKHEDTQLIDDKTVELPPGPIKAGAGVYRRGSSFHAGQQVLATGKWLTPIDIGLLAEIGRERVTVTPRPRVGVLATGNELVECGEPVAPGQIRNSNGPMLMASLAQFGAATTNLGIARDNQDSLRTLIAQGLEADVLLVTGGVSAGVLDLVPSVLAELGVEEIFHKVRVKPGKPLWFGVKAHQSRRTLVFGLPGNPVSTLVSLELFVKPALAALSGHDFAAPRTERGVLAASVDHRGGRPTYHPCHLSDTAGKPLVTPLTWRGSGDLAALTRANALAVLPAGDYECAAGHEVEVLRLA